MASGAELPAGYKWRSSQTLIVSTACFALLTEVLLYGFVVPILPYMLEVRLHQHPSQTQRLTTELLSIHGFSTVVSAPILAHFIDKTPSRRTPLLLSLVVTLVGTALVAFTPSYWALVLGRVLQGITGAAVWIICLAVLVESSGAGNMGKMMGLSMSIVMTGTIGGPVIAGTALELMGYWPTWYLPMGFLAVDIIVWLGLIEPQAALESDKALVRDEPPEHHGASITEEIHSENSPLLSPIIKTDSKDDQTQEVLPSSNFYYIMLTDDRVLVSLGSVVMTSAITAGFNATLPVHLRDIFEWGPLDVGTMFLILRVPGIILGPLSGWLRDIVGLRYPTMIGWVILAPLLVLMGIPGNGLLWASAEGYGKPIFVSAIVGIGAALPLIQGSGILHIMIILEELESKQPNIFGAHGGRSRAFGMNEVAFNLGLMVGPLSGLLSEKIGFDHMSMILACMSIAVGLACGRFFTAGLQPTDDEATV
ncbi:major facilitator superfamily domain-containing protein [Penicillium malachiteum]|nr:major facilitator superfamily domain-containing protein [Penicillium malachiteum]